jgi:hypothetical protein
MSWYKTKYDDDDDYSSGYGSSEDDDSLTSSGNSFGGGSILEIYRRINPTFPRPSKDQFYVVDKLDDERIAVVPNPRCSMSDIGNVNDLVQEKWWEYDDNARDLRRGRLTREGWVFPMSSYHMLVNFIRQFSFYAVEDWEAIDAEDEATNEEWLALREELEEEAEEDDDEEMMWARFLQTDGFIPDLNGDSRPVPVYKKASQAQFDQELKFLNIESRTGLRAGTLKQFDLARHKFVSPPAGTTRPRKCFGDGYDAMRGKIALEKGVYPEDVAVKEGKDKAGLRTISFEVKGAKKKKPVAKKKTVAAAKAKKAKKATPKKSAAATKKKTTQKKPATKKVAKKKVVAKQKASTNTKKKPLAKKAKK